MGVFIQESYPSIKDRVNRWNELGMLESIKCEESRKLVSIVLDTTSLYLMEFKYFNIDNDTKLCLIPIMVKLFRDTEKKFSIIDLNKFVKRIIEDFTIKYKEFCFINLSNENDEETEFIIQYCKNFKFN